jgi:hypothetical protein
VIYYVHHTKILGSSGTDEIAVDVQNSMDFMHVVEGATSCLTEKGDVWLMRSQRMVLGIEAFLLQGGSAVDFPAVKESTNKMLKDLAGNAFNGPYFIYFFCSVVVALGEIADVADPLALGEIAEASSACSEGDESQNPM